MPLRRNLILYWFRVTTLKLKCFWKSPNTFAMMRLPRLRQRLANLSLSRVRGRELSCCFFFLSESSDLLVADGRIVGSNAPSVLRSRFSVFVRDDKYELIVGMGFAVISSVSKDAVLCSDGSIITKRRPWISVYYLRLLSVVKERHSQT